MKTNSQSNDDLISVLLILSLVMSIGLQGPLIGIIVFILSVVSITLLTYLIEPRHETDNQVAAAYDKVCQEKEDAKKKKA